eukprot:scaffold83822_cov20-Tisochrysis_lutea.AAC.1
MHQRLPPFFAYQESGQGHQDAKQRGNDDGHDGLRGVGVAQQRAWRLVLPALCEQTCLGLRLNRTPCSTKADAPRQTEPDAARMNQLHQLHEINVKRQQLET